MYYTLHYVLYTRVLPPPINRLFKGSVFMGHKETLPGVSLGKLWGVHRVIGRGA